MAKKGFNSLRTLIAFYSACLMCAMAPQVQANSCDKDKARAEHYEQLLRRGGTARQMNLWRAKREDYEDKFFHCRTNPDTNPSIQVASGASNTSPNSRKPTLVRQKTRSTNSPDPQLQQLVNTCNYWIESVNLSPSQDNISFCNSACSAVDKRERELKAPKESIAEPQGLIVQKAPARKLQECMKPNKLIDNEVNECMQGRQEPTWVK